jgi:hypothetical protein
MRGSRTAALSIVTLTGTAVLLTGCSGGSDESTASLRGGTADSTDQFAGQVPGSAEDTALVGTASGAKEGSAKTTGNGVLADLPGERDVIATAEMTLRSQDVGATVDAIELIATSAGGFVSGRDVNSNPDDPKGTRAVIVIRVPTTKLDAVISQAQDEGDVVRVTADEQDVTQTVVDVDSRVESARASVDRIRSLLSEATTIGEVVRIESELSRREADLESLLAQQRSLADQTSLATLSVTVLAPNAVEVPPTETTGFLPGLQRGWDALVGLVVVALTTIGILLPFLVVGALVLGPIAAAWRRRHQKVLASTASTGTDEAPREREPEPVG